jgi:hypothetical protein
MPTLRNGIAITAAVLMASAATVAATESAGSAAPSWSAACSGISVLNTAVNLPAGAWTDTPLEVSLPQAGTYELDADVRGRLQGTSPLNTYITARLWNVTSNRQVAHSERLVYQLINITGGNQTAPISELITVNRPTTIQLQAQDINATGTASIAQIYSDYHGYTTLRFVRIGP